MMVQRPETESPPPPPPPPLPGGEEEGTSPDATPANGVDEPKNEESVDVDSSNQAPLDNSPPSLLDDLDDINHVPVQSQAISITLKNAPPVQKKAETPTNSPQPSMQTPPSQSALSLVEPPMHVLMPAQKQLGALPPPRMSIPPPSLSHPGGLPHSMSQSHIRIPPPSIVQSGGRMPNIPTSIPPPNFLPPGLPPLGALPPVSLLRKLQTVAMVTISP